MSEAVAAGSEPAVVQDLRRTLARMELALSQISDALVIVDDACRMLWCNGTFERQIGQPRLMITGQPLAEALTALLPGEGRLDLPRLLAQSPEGGTVSVIGRREPLQVFELEWRPVAWEDSRPYVLRFHDISDRISLEALRIRSRELHEQQLSLAAQVITCPVTGLPNRRGLLQAIDAAIAGLRHQPGWLAVLFCDLNHFKDVNDTYGHHVGDQLLIELAQRMQAVLRPQDVVARLGGDEFVLLCSPLDHPEEALQIAHRLLAAVAAPWSPQQEGVAVELFPAMSVGIAWAQGADCCPDQLLQDADLAMYEAKSLRSRQPVVFDARLAARLDRRQQIRQALHQALADRVVPLSLQPIVRLRDGQLIGYECLCRPRDASGAPIAPDAFVHEAEAAGQMALLGQLLLEQSFQAAAQLQLDQRGLRLGVNFSPQQLQHGGVVDAVIALAARHRLPAGMVGIEVSEAALLDQPSRVHHDIQRLRDAGFRLILDGFGLGHASLNALADLPIDGLKLDHTFTATLLTDRTRALLIGALIGLSRDLGLELVVEGVETLEQRERLLAMGAELAQGHLFSAAQPLEEALRWPSDQEPFVGGSP